MKVKDLIDILSLYPERDIVLAGDAEGNTFTGLHELSLGELTNAGNGHYQPALLPGSGQEAVVLWPF
jgi:hypothetical protein